MPASSHKHAFAFTMGVKSCFIKAKEDKPPHREENDEK